MQIKGIIFDKDGTLFDSETINLKYWQEAFVKYGFSDSTEVISKCIGLDHKLGDKLLKEHYGNIVDEMRKYKVLKVREFMEENIMPFRPYAKEVLDNLKERLPLALATSTTKDVAYYNLKKAGIFNHFKGIVTGEDVVKGKPNPEIFLKASTYLNAKPSEIIVVEDSIPGIIGAYEGGFIPVFIPDKIKVNEEVLKHSKYIFKDLLEFYQFLVLKSFNI